MDIEEKRRHEAYEFLQQCKDELKHAESMGNVKRIEQCKKWVAQAQSEYDQIVKVRK